MKWFYIYCAFALPLAACTRSNYNSVSAGGEASQGQGGSMARFAISGSYLYTLDNPYVIKYDISRPAAIMYVNENSLGQGAVGETLFAHDTLLYVGSRGGMYIMGLEYLQMLGTIHHFYSCDPVIVADTFAFVTLNAANACRWGNMSSELQIYSVKDPRSPHYIRSLRMTAPQGLAMRDSLLFVCDEGIRVYDARTPALQLPLLASVPKDNNGIAIDAYDIILSSDSTAILIGATGLFQYAYTLAPADNSSQMSLTMELLSSIVSKKAGE